MINVIGSRFLKKAYRQEPITSFILTVAAVDLIIGAVGQRWTLLSFGATVVAIATVLRWRKIQKAKEISREESPRYYLSPQSSRTALPTLKNEKNRHP
jgi:hypothetical protein